MNTAQVVDKPSNKSLDEVLIELRQGVFDSTHNTNIRTYNKLSQLGLTNAATINDVIEAMPINSIVMIDAYIGIHNGFDIPESGQIAFYRGNSTVKAYVDFKHEHFGLTRTYNTYYTPALQRWIGSTGSVSIKSEAIGNKAVNIPFTGIYYYVESAEAGKLTDRPSGANTAGVILKKEKIGVGSVYLITYMQNDAALALWQCTVDDGVKTPWVSRA